MEMLPAVLGVWRRADAVALQTLRDLKTELSNAIQSHQYLQLENEGLRQDIRKLTDEINRTQNEQHTNLPLGGALQDWRNISGSAESTQRTTHNSNQLFQPTIQKDSENGLAHPETGLSMNI